MVELLEALAALEHDQWCTWTQAMAITLAPSEMAMILRWQSLWVPYENLPETEKETDRAFARLVLDELQRYGVNLNLKNVDSTGDPGHKVVK